MKCPSRSAECLRKISRSLVFSHGFCAWDMMRCECIFHFRRDGVGRGGGVRCSGNGPSDDQVICAGADGAFRSSGARLVIA